MNKKENIDFNKIQYKRTQKYVIFERFEFSKLIHNVAELKFQNKDLKDDNILYRKIIIGGAIIILILIACILSFSYETGVQKCINGGQNEKICREGLK